MTLRVCVLICRRLGLGCSISCDIIIRCHSIARHQLQSHLSKLYQLLQQLRGTQCILLGLA